MTPWQVLRAGRAAREARAALGYRLNHGPGVSVHYSTTTATSAAQNSSGSLCLSREKLTLQQLNRRLALYLQQVQCLEANNQMLERKIEKELRRKCPRELRQLDKHLRTVALLQDQISACLSAQAQIRLQLHSTELLISDFSIRCEKERECCGCLEVELSALRLLEEELNMHKLPELQSLLNNQMQQLMELQIKHQQDTQGLQAQASRGIAVELHAAESLDLIKQLGHLRQMSVPLLDKNNKSWFNTQVAVLSSPMVTFNPLAQSDVIQAELEERRRTVAGLEEELKQLQDLNVLLEASGLEQTESFFLQLGVLQHRTDGLCRELHSLSQAAAERAADHQALLDVKSQLVTEIQDYMRLLDEMSQESPAASRRNVPLDRTVQGGHLGMVRAQSGSRVHIHTIGNTPILTQHSEIITKVQPIRVYSKHPKNSPVITKHAANLRSSFQKIVKQTAAFPNRTGRKSMTMIRAMINRQSTPVEANVQVEDCDVRKSLTVCLKTKVNPDAKAKLKQGPQFVTHMTTPDLGKQTAAVLKKETETVILAQTDSCEVSVQAKKKDLGLIMSYKLKTPSETARHIGKVEQNKVTEDANTGSGSATASSSTPDSNSNLESKTANKEILKKLELEVNNDNVVHETTEEKVAPTEMVNVEGQEALFCTTESKRSISLTDSGVILSSSDPEELLSPKVTDAFLSPTKTPAYLSPQTSLSPSETGVFMSMADQVFCQGDLEDHVKSPALFLIPNEPEVYLSPYHTDTCLSPVKTKGSLSPNGEEEDDEEACLSLTEANVYVRPVEKYILSTKEEGQSFSFNKQALPEGDKGITISMTDGNGLCFGSTEGTKERRVTYASTGNGVANDLGGMVASNSGMAGDLAGSFSGMTAGTESSNVETAAAAGLLGRYRHDSGEWMVYSNSSEHSSGAFPSTGSEEGPSMARFPATSQQESGRFSGRGCGEWMVYEGRLGHKSSLDLGTSLPSEANREGPSLTALPAKIPPERGRFSSSGSGTWMVCGGSLDGSDTLSTEESRESPLVATTNVTSPPQRGRFSSSGSGTWMVCGGSLDGSDTLSTEESRESPLVATTNVTSPPQRGRFGSSGSGEWLVYGGSLKCKYSLDDSVSLVSEGSKENPQVATSLITSQPKRGRFGSSGSGEWLVYGGSLGGKRSLHNGVGSFSSGSEDGPSVATLPATNQSEAGMFNNRGGGEWIIYGGSLTSSSDGLPSAESEKYPPVFTQLATSTPETGRKWMAYGSSPKCTSSVAGSSSLQNTEIKEWLSTATNLATSPPGTGKFCSRESEELIVNAGNPEHMSSLARSNSLANSDSKDRPFVAGQLAISQTAAQSTGRFDSGEWKVNGGSTGCLSSTSSTDRVSISNNEGQIISPPNSYMHKEPKPSGGRLSSGSVVRRSSSVDSGCRLSSSGSGRKLSSSPSSHRISRSGKLTSTGSDEWKPVYSAASGCRSSVGSAGQSGRGRTTSSTRSPSPGGTTHVEECSGEWLSSSITDGNQISSVGSGPKLSSLGNDDTISSRAGGRINTGGRVISSSDRPIRNTSSRSRGNKERISVCKMAALSISAAGRERSQETQRQAQRSQQQQQSAATPVVQHWLTTSVRVKSVDPDGLDDIAQL